MIRILCTGDSHTWGQGAEGLDSEFNPSWVGGELRLTTFRTGTYVNRLRALVNEVTGSAVTEWLADELAADNKLEFRPPCAVIGAEGITVCAKGALIRVECAMINEISEVEILLDDQPVYTAALSTSEPQNAYRIATIHAEDAVHRLTIRAKRGKVCLYRIESYTGPCAVINSGIGSCPVQQMRGRFWADYASAVKPDVMLMEAHTINDWLTGDTPEQYREHLLGMIDDCDRLGAEPILVTVAPIGGEQKLDGTADEYGLFVEASREAARIRGIRLCDVNRIMTILSDGMTEDQMKQLLLADNWHVNDRGQAIYAQLQFEALANAGYIR